MYLLLWSLKVSDGECQGSQPTSPLRSGCRVNGSTRHRVEDDPKNINPASVTTAFATGTRMSKLSQVDDTFAAETLVAPPGVPRYLYFVFAIAFFCLIGNILIGFDLDKL